MALLRHLLLIASLALPGAGLAAGEAGFAALMDEMSGHPEAFDGKRIERLAASLKGTEGVDLQVAWHESRGEWGIIARDIAVPCMKRSALLAQDAFLLASCGEALARTGSIATARPLLGQGDWSGSGAGPALVMAALGRIACQERDWPLARNYIGNGLRALQQAGYSDGAPWRTTIARRRLNALQDEVARGSLTETLGPDFLLWQDAERAAENRKDKADHLKDLLAVYDRIAAEHPAGRFAAPARLEAARIAWSADKAEECRNRLGTLLQRKDDQTHGLVCLLAADAEIRFGGDPSAIRRLCQEAIDWCSLHAAAIPLDGAVARLVAPTSHPHAMAGWNLPVWHPRERTRLWTWDAAPWMGSYISYQALTRLIVVSVLTGNHRAAIDYAQNLTRFDLLDQEMVQQGRQAGPTILAAAIKDRSFFLPLETLAQLPPEAQLRLMTALVYYQLYDWPTARGWAESALAGVEPKDAARRNPILYLIGFTWMGSHDDRRAMDCWRQVGDGNRRPDRYWGLVRMAQASLLANQPPRQQEALALLLQVAGRLAPSAEAENALLRAVNLSESLDPDTCRSAALRLLATYPRSTYAPFTKDVLARLDARPPTSRKTSP